VRDERCIFRVELALFKPHDPTLTEPLREGEHASYSRRMRYPWVLIVPLLSIAITAASCGSGGNNTTTGGHGGASSAGSGQSGVGAGDNNPFATGVGVGTGTGTGIGGSATTSGGNCSGAVTCEMQGANCGPASDGCGGIIQCGDCTAPETCGGGGTPSVCGGKGGCVAKTCANLGLNCGPASDGCGGQLDCGTCAAPDTCGGGGTASVCGHGSSCVPKTCAQAGANCGPVGDGCGGLLDCGTCAPPQTCGGSGVSSTCGAPTCKPKTCAQAGANCGPVGDGCGGLLDCGTCQGNEVCGATSPNVCGTSTTCTNLCLKQVKCMPSTTTTTVSGTVFAPGHLLDPPFPLPGSADPLVNALVYVPNSAVQAFSAGVSCEQCGAQASGSPLVSAVTGPDGKFVLKNMPVGTNIPLVIQLGRWRRQVVIPKVDACKDTALPASLTRLPRNKTEGDIPQIAFATGAVDSLECVLRKIGVDDSEFTLPSANGRIHLYKGSGDPGANLGNKTPSETALWGSVATLKKYDLVFFPCQGKRYGKTSTQQQNVIDYTSAGGRVFATHYSYVWLYNDVPFSTTAQWKVDQGNIKDQNGIIDTSFPKGLALAQWLQNVKASTVYGQIPIQVLRHDADGVVAPTQSWMTTTNPPATMHMTFNTPVGVPATQQCGRVLFDDFHVEDATASQTQVAFPKECDSSPMTPQEKLLEFMIFDLGSCIAPDKPVCTPKTCSQIGVSCGPAGDGCGGVIQCGSCPAGQTCGGGGVPGQCGAPTCTPKTCAQLGLQCGPAGDGCGGVIQCGSCPAGQTCGGGGMPGVCGNQGCTPKTCAQLGLQCGPAGDGCGGLLQCGSCATGQTCGGGGTPGVCGTPPCTPQTCAQIGADCGPVGNGCGGIIDCGTCAPPQTCGGGGKANVCGGTIPK
jgi:hypothetical protein